MAIYSAYTGLKLDRALFLWLFSTNVFILSG